VISPSQRPLPTQHTTNPREEHPCPQRNSNPRSQQSPIPLAARSKAWVGGGSLAGIAGSNSARCTDVSVVTALYCQVQVSATGRFLFKDQDLFWNNPYTDLSSAPKRETAGWYINTIIHGVTPQTTVIFDENENWSYTTFTAHFHCVAIRAHFVLLFMPITYNGWRNAPAAPCAACVLLPCARVSICFVLIYSLYERYLLISTCNWCYMRSSETQTDRGLFAQIVSLQGSLK
jgi:hypothetical protein